MKGEMLREALDRAVEHEFETPVDLMPRIRSRLTNRQPVVKPRLTLRWAATVFVGMFVTVATVYAISSLLRQAMLQDDGITYVESKGLGQALDITTTVDGLTLHLEWAYADRERISLGYTVEFPEGVDTTTFYPFTNLISDDGRVFGQTSSEVSSEESRIGYVQDFTSYNMEEAPDILNLRLVGRFSTLQHGEPQTFGPVSLRFSVPFNRGHRLAQPVTVEANGIPMTLNQVTVTPSMLIVELCYASDIDPGGRMEIDWTLNIGGESVTTDQTMMVGLYGEQDRCASYRLDVSVYEAQGTWTITVNELFDYWTGLLETEDLLRRHNEGQDWETTYAELESRGLIQRVPGPWIFEFELETTGDN